MSRPPRNKIEGSGSALHDALRTELAAYWRGIGPDARPHTVSECIAWLRTEHGIAEDDLPGANAFTEWAKSVQFKKRYEDAMIAGYGDSSPQFRADMLKYKREAAEKQAMAQALALGGGAGGAIDLGMYEAALELRGAIKDAEDPSLLPKIATALRGLKGAVLAQAKESRNAELDRLKADHAAAIAAKDAEIAQLKADLEAARNGGKSVDLKQVADNMERLLGGGAK